MSRKQMDAEDVLAGTLFTLSTASSAGIASVSVFGVSLKDILFSISPIDITIAGIVGLVTFAAVAFTNGFDRGSLEKMAPEELFALFIAGLGVFSVSFVPAVQDAVQSSDILGIGATALGGLLLFFAGYYG